MLRALLLLACLLGAVAPLAADQLCVTLSTPAGTSAPACVPIASGGPPPTVTVAAGLDTALTSGNGGLDVFTLRLDASDTGLALLPKAMAPPLNPSGGIPFALSVLGDTWLGDVYCLADEEVLAFAGASSGCIYGKSRTGHRVGPVIYQSNAGINVDGGIGGPGMVLWADRPNIDGSGNQGYYDIWAWGAAVTDYSNSLNFGNRGAGGEAHRRFRIRGDGRVQLPDLTGPGVERLCLGPDGTLQRGGC